MKVITVSHDTGSTEAFLYLIADYESENQRVQQLHLVILLPIFLLNYFWTFGVTS
jgi:hypothetical protein